MGKLNASSIGMALVIAGSSSVGCARQRVPEVRAEAMVRAASGFTDADYEKHVEELKGKLPSKDFSIVIERPFVVVGDEPEEVVRQRAADTVRWAVTLLKKDFFAKDPVSILDIWLFKDAASYRKHAQELFKDEPTTPYGYYSSENKALIMNIETGGGTLVHEIVHPFIESNFPEAPAWLNEGLGSLFEQCGEADGHIRGYTNWRLPGLQRTIRARKLPTFRTLMAMDARTFYRGERGDNYAQSRYLLYYLQERDLLVSFYREFYAARKTDPTGVKTLQKITGERDLEAFQVRWEKYILELDEEFRLRPLRR